MSRRAVHPIRTATLHWERLIAVSRKSASPCSYFAVAARSPLDGTGAHSEFVAFSPGWCPGTRMPAPTASACSDHRVTGPPNAAPVAWAVYAKRSASSPVITILRFTVMPSLHPAPGSCPTCSILQPRRWRNGRPKGNKPATPEVRIRAVMPSPGRASGCDLRPPGSLPRPAPGRGRRAGPCYRLQSSLSGTARLRRPACDRMSSPL